MEQASQASVLNPERNPNTPPTYRPGFFMKKLFLERSDFQYWQSRKRLLSVVYDDGEIHGLRPSLGGEEGGDPGVSLAPLQHPDLNQLR